VLVESGQPFSGLEGLFNLPARMHS
jgi:hypothetical protein